MHFFPNSENINETFKSLRSLPTGTICSIPAGTILYRSTHFLEQNPAPRNYGQNHDQGLFFSANSPYLAELVTRETGKPSIIEAFKLLEAVTVVVSKPGSHGSDAPRLSFPSFNADIPASCGELFLNQQQFSKIRFIMFYNMKP